jgi:ABC-type molybdenum transport system ATPase subunit/photorepair protein PhrA
MFARALARRPELIVLDKAYDGLDAPSRRYDIVTVMVL